MTQDEIIRMAREAGFTENKGNCYGDHNNLERFAALVAEATKNKIADEAQKNGNEILAMQIRNFRSDK